MSTVPSEVIRAAQASMRKWDVPAAVTIAQWAVESAWGKSMSPGSNNPFGIKAVAGQPSVTSRTREVIRGQSVYIDAAFRKFASLDEAFDAHAQLLATSHYYTAAMAVRGNPDAFADKLTGVYATDPNYGTVLKSVMKSSNLYQYDTLPKGPAPMANSASPNTPNAPAPTAPSVTTPTPATASSTTSIAATAASAAAPKSVPTISQSVHVDAGSAMSSLVAVAEKYRPTLEGLADSAENFAFSKIPFGSFIEQIVGPHLAAQYVDKAMTDAEALAEAAGTKLGNQDVLSMAVSAFTTVESWLDTFGLGSGIETWVKDAAAKVGLAI